jgi:hypothetical protein
MSKAAIARGPTSRLTRPSSLELIYAETVAVTRLPRSWCGRCAPNRDQIILLLAETQRWCRATLRPLLRLEARREPVRQVAGGGRDLWRASDRSPYVRVLGVRAPRRSDRSGRTSRGHRDTSRFPRSRRIPPHDVGQHRRTPRGRCRLRLQYAEREEPARLPEDGLARSRAAFGRGPTFGRACSWKDVAVARAGRSVVACNPGG